jgi:hypothetical protein
LFSFEGRWRSSKGTGWPPVNVRLLEGNDEAIHAELDVLTYDTRLHGEVKGMIAYKLVLYV